MPDRPGIPPGDPTKHKHLAAALRDQIRAGILKPGQPVPSITRLAADWGWARGTCAKALQALQREGLLTRYPGLGYYVSSPEPEDGGPDRDDADGASATPGLLPMTGPALTRTAPG